MLLRHKHTWSLSVKILGVEIFGSVTLVNTTKGLSRGMSHVRVRRLYL